MEIPQLTECTTVVVSGPVSSGKSWLLRQWFNTMERVVAIDTTADLLDSSYTHVWASPQQLAYIIQENEFYYRVAYHPKDLKTAFDWCAKIIWSTTGSRWLIIDEVHEVCDTRSMVPMMETCLRYSRHNMLGIIGSSQRIQDVSRLLTSAARMNVLFYTDEARSLDAIYDRWGKEVVEEVINCRPCVYDDVSKTVYQHPECIVIVRGIGYKKFALGDLVLPESKNGGNQAWQKLTKVTPEPQKDNTPAEPYSADPSGKQEKPLPENTSGLFPRQ